MTLLRKLRQIPGVKKVFIRSGVRFDYVVADRDKTFLNELVEHHVSGQLRVAPEHVSDQVLKYMGKPCHSVYEEFLREYDKANKRTGRQQYAVPYFMSSHPGCTMKEAVKPGGICKRSGVYPGTGAGFLPYTIHSFYLYVLYRDPSPHRRKGICAQKSP